MVCHHLDSIKIKGVVGMSFLSKLLPYRNICIQCHNNPDADAVSSAFGVYRFLRSRNIDAEIVYGGSQMIKKNNLKIMIEECGIPISYRRSIEGFDLLLVVDGQYGEGNVEKFPADKVMIIDHHIQMVEDDEDYLIDSEYQSCATMIWEMLEEEGYRVKEDKELSVALLYGLYTDTSGFSDLFSTRGVRMKEALFADQPLFERLIKSSMSVMELLVASDAMYHHYFDVERRFAVVEAIKCEQTVLGIIGDFMIQVDAVYLSFAYTEAGAGYQISLRTCHDRIPANKVAEYVCEGIGGGGGHLKKAGGRIVKEKMKEKYGDMSISEVVEMRLARYIDEFVLPWS